MIYRASILSVEILIGKEIEGKCANIFMIALRSGFPSITPHLPDPGVCPAGEADRVRRFARLTDAFSKKVENHMHAIPLHCMYYNFGHIHQSPRVTPAMEAGIADHVWFLEEIAGLVKDKPPRKRGHARKEIQTEPLPGNQ